MSRPAGLMMPAVPVVISAVISIVIHVMHGVLAVVVMMFVPGPRGSREQYNAQRSRKSDGRFPHSYLHRVVDLKCCASQTSSRYATRKKGVQLRVEFNEQNELEKRKYGYAKRVDDT